MQIPGKYRYSAGTIRSILCGTIVFSTSGCGQQANIGGGATPGPEISVAAVSAQLSSFDSKESWRKGIFGTKPPGKGCFHAAMPDTTWTQVPCGSPRQRPLLPRQVGDMSGDDTAVIDPATGNLHFVEGTFPSVSGVNNSTSDTEYSLQINTNKYYEATTCAGALNPAQCLVWQQFVYEASAARGLSLSSVFIEYWLLNYGPSCPPRWISSLDSGSQDCWINGDEISNAPYASPASLGGVFMEGETENGTDYLFFTAGNGTAEVNQSDSFFDLTDNWTTAEFNIFGSDSGMQFHFNSGVTLSVNIATYNGSLRAPTFVPQSFTAETNNLNLVPAGYCPYAGTPAPGGFPTLLFVESNVVPLVAAPFCLLNEQAAAILPLL